MLFVDLGASIHLVPRGCSQMWIGTNFANLFAYASLPGCLSDCADRAYMPLARLASRQILKCGDVTTGKNFEMILHWFDVIHDRGGAPRRLAMRTALYHVSFRVNLHGLRYGLVFLKK